MLISMSSSSSSANAGTLLVEGPGLLGGRVVTLVEEEEDVSVDVVGCADVALDKAGRVSFVTLATAVTEDDTNDDVDDDVDDEGTAVLVPTEEGTGAAEAADAGTVFVVGTIAAAGGGGLGFAVGFLFVIKCMLVGVLS